MSNRLRNDRQFTLDDLALELGLSKSTVSRALSGSGRIAAETVRRVKACAEARGFRPNLAARALAGQKSLNIAAVMPFESTYSQMLFYHECLSGMVPRADEAGYSILLAMTKDDSLDTLSALLHDRKADAAILTQLKHEDARVAFLKEAGFPFVVIGSGAGDHVAQVDSRMEENCAAFTLACCRKLAAGDRVLFVCGSLAVEANNKRLAGFLAAMDAAGICRERYAVCTDSPDLASNLNLRDWRLLLCSDDVVCLHLLELVKRDSLEVGRNLLVASFHDSVLLESQQPPVSALRVDARALGQKAVETALLVIEGKKYEEMNYVDCSFEMRPSTGD